MSSRQSYADFIRSCAYKREQIDQFLDPNAPNVAKFDPELGYVLRDSMCRDGMEGSFAIYSYGEHDERRMINGLDAPCRINTYGNSFTQSSQVNDGESWQEYLAAHLYEPVRNFGVGGYGVYQAYRRMLRMEEIVPAEYVLLNIWGLDDNFRSLDRWRGTRVQGWYAQPGHEDMFHANPWAHVRINANTGEVEEHDNANPTPESLYDLCDPDYVWEHYKDDVMVHMFLAKEGKIEVPVEPMAQLAQTMSLNLNLRGGALRDSASRLQLACGLQATQYILKKAQTFTRERGKKFMVLLSYADINVVQACEGRPRPDQPLLDFMDAEGIRYADSLVKHVEEFETFKLCPWDYARRYYIGHYKPSGNHFFAFAIKNDVVDWLDPKPVPYREANRHVVSYKDYLPS